MTARAKSRAIRRFGIKPAHPGSLVASTSQGDEDNEPVSIAVAARALGVSRQTIYRLVAGQMRISPELAVRLGVFVGNGPGLWIRM